MGVEIERKFLVTGSAYRASGTATPYAQGYLATDPDRTVRVRIAGERAFLTVKGRARGITRSEFEYEIPRADAEELLGELCLQPHIEKLRYAVPVAGRVWTVDEFAGENAGLVLAEVELPAADAEFVKPSWCGAEVSADPRYSNANLVRQPFSRW